MTFLCRLLVTLLSDSSPPLEKPCVDRAPKREDVERRSLDSVMSFFLFVDLVLRIDGDALGRRCGGRPQVGELARSERSRFF